MQHNEPPLQFKCSTSPQKRLLLPNPSLSVCMLWCWRRLRRRQSLLTGSLRLILQLRSLETARYEQSAPISSPGESYIPNAGGQHRGRTVAPDTLMIAWNIAALDWAIILFKACQGCSVSDLSPETRIHCPRKVTAEWHEKECEEGQKPLARCQRKYRFLWEWVWYLKSEVNHTVRVGPRLPFLHFSVLSPTSPSTVSLVTTWNHTRPKKKGSGI